MTDEFLTDEEEYKLREERIVLCERIEDFIHGDPRLSEFSKGAVVDAGLDLILHMYYDMYGDAPESHWESEKERLRYACEVLIGEVEKRREWNRKEQK